MSKVAGASVERGVYVAGANVDGKDFSLGAINYYSNDVINIFYTEGKYALALADGYTLKLAAQYSDQRSTGDDLLTGQSFSTHQWGIKGDMNLGAALLTAGLHGHRERSRHAQSLERVSGLHQRAGEGLQPRRRVGGDAEGGLRFLSSRRRVDRLRAARLPLHTMFVSHLKAEDLARLQQQFPQTRFRARIGTRLWLGDHDATEYRGAVLDVTHVAKGDRFGYRQQKAASDGYLVVVAGGTSHGVGLEAPKALHGVMPRAKGVARAGLATVNRNLSPFVWDGKQRWFAEPPHMQVSILFVPVGRQGAEGRRGAGGPSAAHHHAVRPHRRPLIPGRITCLCPLRKQVKGRTRLRVRPLAHVGAGPEPVRSERTVLRGPAPAAAAPFHLRTVEVRRVPRWMGRRAEHEDVLARRPGRPPRDRPRRPCARRPVPA